MLHAIMNDQNRLNTILQMNINGLVKKFALQEFVNGMGLIKMILEKKFYDCMEIDQFKEGWYYK